MKDQRNKTSIIFTILFSLCRDMKNLRFFYALEVAYCTVERNFNQRHSARDYISWMRNFIRKLPSLCIPCKHDLAIQKREINISLIERASERARERERERERVRIKGCAGLKGLDTTYNTGKKKGIVWKWNSIAIIDKFESSCTYMLYVNAKNFLVKIASQIFLFNQILFSNNLRNYI